MTKKELRILYQERRLDLGATERAIRSEHLCRVFFSGFDLSSVRTIHIFLPLERKHEPDTWLIIDEIKKQQSRIRIAVPRINTEVNGLDSYIYEDRSTLEENTLGIPEPQIGMKVEPHEIDLVLVPLLIFDRNGHRVGYGKGFYDRFLKLCKPSCLRVGISFFEPVDQIDDVNSDDIPLTYGITPAKCYAFTRQAPAD